MVKISKNIFCQMQCTQTFCIKTNLIICFCPRLDEFLISLILKKIFEISRQSRFFGLFWPILAYIRFFCISEAISVEIIATMIQFQNSTVVPNLEHIMLRKAHAHFFGHHFVCLPRISHYIHIYKAIFS